MSLVSDSAHRRLSLSTFTSTRFKEIPDEDALPPSQFHDWAASRRTLPVTRRHLSSGLDTGVLGGGDVVLGALLAAGTQQCKLLSFFPQSLLFFLFFFLNVSSSYPPLKSSFWYDHAEIPGKHVQVTASRSAQLERLSATFIPTTITILGSSSGHLSAVTNPHTGAVELLTAAPSRLLTRGRADPPIATITLSARHRQLATPTRNLPTRRPPACSVTRSRRDLVAVCSL